MGLLSVPKKYNPPGNGKRDIEYPIFATKQEMGLLKMRGGSGKMTKHGIRSYGLGDKGNSVGSAGASNYSGDGAGGQVNLNNVGGNTGNVLKNINGKWTVVSKDAQLGGGGNKAPAVMPAYVPPVVQTIAQPVPAAISVPSIPASTLAAQYGMYKNPTANMPATTTAPASYPNSMPGNVNQSLNYGPGTSSPTVNAVSPLGMGGTRGSWSTPASPSPNSMPGNSDPGMNYGPGTTPSTLQGMGGTRGSWATPSRPPNNMPSSSSPPSAPTPNFQAGAGRYGPANPNLPDPRFNVGNMDAFGLSNAPANLKDPVGFDLRDGLSQIVAGDPSRIGGTQPTSLAERAAQYENRMNSIADFTGMGRPTTPASLNSYSGAVPKSIIDRVPEAQTKVTPQNYGFVSPPNDSTVRPENGVTQSSMINKFSPLPSEQEAGFYAKTKLALDAAKRGRESAVGVPASLGDVNIDPTGNPIVDFLKERAQNTQLYQTTEKIFNAVDRAANGQYYDDVSFGTDESGRRTDRAPSGGNAGTWNPKGGDSPNPYGGRATGSSAGYDGRGQPYTPPSGGGGNGGGNPAPVTPALANWFYPQYTQDWAGLPTGIGGPIWKAPKLTNEVDPLDPANWLNGLLGR